MAEGDVHVTWREDDAKWSVVREGASPLPVARNGSRGNEHNRGDA